MAVQFAQNISLFLQKTTAKQLNSLIKKHKMSTIPTIAIIPDVEDCEGMDEDDIAEMMQEDMEQDIHYLAVIYNPEDEEHVMVMHDQNDKPHEI